MPAAKKTPGADAEAGQPATSRPGSVGRLIPPAEPAGPPAHSLLREDDFAYSACQLALAGLGTVYTEAPPVTGEQRDCGIDRPLQVTEILPGVTLEGGPLMRCDTARALAWWMRDFVQPAARRLPGAPQVTSMALGSTYECRGTVGATTSGLSEHALGNAIDIASFTFDDKAVLPVAATDEGSASQAFLAAVRWVACMDFATVLGPGSNAAHANHLHLDVKKRRGGYRVCE
ncbi:extensin family protein [Paracoccus suum]|uniref:extensin-like domain-containing protein n=1 Tax=Paracoccus suum TaxID=2259340 RepID=UPI001F540B51|nr:extensin family protein [Paracoccus suum]